MVAAGAFCLRTLRFRPLLYNHHMTAPLASEMCNTPNSASMLSQPQTSAGFHLPEITVEKLTSNCRWLYGDWIVFERTKHCTVSQRMVRGPLANGKMYLTFCILRLGSSVTIASDYGLDDRGSIPGRVEGFFPLASVSTPALKSTQPPIHLFLSPRVNRGRGVTLDHSTASSADDKNE
jgi:hypothetical protein